MQLHLRRAPSYELTACVGYRAGDDDKIEDIIKHLCATHKCDAKVFNPELIKLIGSQGDVWSFKSMWAQ
jgi:hypothetical protein